MTASGGAIINGRRPDIVDFANTHRLPSIGGSMWADAGFLVAYGPYPLTEYRRAAYYVASCAEPNPSTCRSNSRLPSIWS